MACMRGAHLTDNQKSRLLVDERGNVSGRFITALQQLDELSQDEGFKWHNDAFRYLHVSAAPIVKSSRGVLRQAHGCSGYRDVAFLLVETTDLSDPLTLHVQWSQPNAGEIYRMSDEQYCDIKRWQLRGGKMLWNSLHTFPVPQAA
jgi:hypothetical protein